MKTMIKLLRYIFSIILLIVFIMQPAAGQRFNISRGLPFIRNYAPEEYQAHEKNFDIMQDAEGLMYFANFAGVLQFDGAGWNKIVSLSGMRILSIDINKQGTIFAGGLYDFGFLKKDTYGQTNFISLISKKDNIEDIGLIFKVICVDDKVWFISENNIYIYDGKQLEIKKLDSKLLSAFQVGADLFFFFDTKIEDQKLGGLYKYVNNNFQKVALAEGQTLFDIRFMIPSIKRDEILIGSENQGLFLLKNNMITEFNVQSNDFLKSHRLSCGVVVGKSTYAIGTNVGGLILINANGEIVQLVDRSSNLQDESINALFLDKGESLWAATNNGISKIEVNWPLSYIDNKTSGLGGKVQDLEFFNNALFIGTDEGLFYLKGNEIQKVEQLNVACLSLLKISNFLMVATSRGIYQVVDNKATKTADNNFTFCLTASKLNPGVFYSGNSGKVSVYQANTNNLNRVGSIENIPGDVLKIIENKLGDIYLEVSPGKIFRLRKGDNKPVELGAHSGFLSLHLNLYNGEVFFSSEKGLYTDYISGDSILPYTLHERDSLIQKLWIHDLYEISENSSIITNGERKELSFLNNNNNNFEINQTPFLPVSSFAAQTFWVNTGKTQICAGGKDGLLLLNFKDLYDYNADFQTIIRKVTVITNDSLLSLDNSKNLEISYADNSLEIDFSVPVYPAAGVVEYRYFLDGFDKDTSAWTKLTKKEYTNLSDGNYKFIVEARNEFGKIAQKASFSFHILTPLYRQWWAILLYIIILIALVRLLFIWRLRASRKEKERLEELVKERTEEIERSRTKIEEQRDIAYKHRKEILDSISYAQKIQQAVLPSTQLADDILLEHFIFYKPRDIVSGDFYWMKKLNNFVAVVAADCTGHGVPGAFMSMLGSSFLNEIVTRRSMDSAAQILNRLRAKVKRSLHQEGKEGEQKDGMDIALLIIDNETLNLQYAGAYNPLYIIRPKEGVNALNEDLDIETRYELIHLKADRQPIGIHLAEKEFTNHQFQLQAGDNIYSFSDGYVDQFGGETGEKFKSKRFKELLMSIQGKPMDEQKKIIEQAFMKWKRDLAQIDDVLVMGIRV